MNAGLSSIATAVLSLGLNMLLTGCAGPIPLSVAIDPQDEQAYLAVVNKTDLDGRRAFADWMSKERGIPPAQVLVRDAKLSSTRNPFDAYRDRRAVSRGAVIYEVHCQRCHGVDARGGGPATLPDHPGPDFKSFAKRFAATVHRGAPRKWFRVIRDGGGDKVVYPEGPGSAMPAFGEKLAREQIWWVITYLQSLDIHTPPGAEASEGGDR